jgi:nitrogen fixation protein FixH
MSWGTKIAFLYISFAGMIAFMVYKSSMQNVDLVAPNYYEQELSYQDKIDGMNNLNAESNAIVIQQSEGNLAISFSKEIGTPEGHILLFKPDNASSDFKTEIKTDNKGVQVIDTRFLSKGTYLVKIDWKVGAKKFFKEERISIN